MTEDRVQLVDDLAAEFDRVEQSHRGHERGWRGLLAQRRPSLFASRHAQVATFVILLLAAASYTVPTTRAAIDDATGSFAGWVAGSDEAAPGRAIRPSDDAPGWLQSSPGTTRLIAKVEGVGLYVTKSQLPGGEPYLDFSLGKDAAIVGATPDVWRERFDERAVVVLGPAPTRTGEQRDERGRFPLLGVVAKSVARVELRYATGPPTTASGLSGGFVLMADSKRSPREIVALDGRGKEVDRIDVSDFSAPGG